MSGKKTYQEDLSSVCDNIKRCPMKSFKSGHTVKSGFSLPASLSVTGTRKSTLGKWAGAGPRSRNHHGWFTCQRNKYNLCSQIINNTFHCLTVFNIRGGYISVGSDKVLLVDNQHRDLIWLFIIHTLCSQSNSHLYLAALLASLQPPGIQCLAQGHVSVVDTLQNSDSSAVLLFL